MTQLTYTDGRQAGWYDAEHNERFAWDYDNGILQSEDWKRGYRDGYTDFQMRQAEIRHGATS